MTANTTLRLYSPKCTRQLCYLNLLNSHELGQPCAGLTAHIPGSTEPTEVMLNIVINCVCCLKEDQ